MRVFPFISKGLSTRSVLTFNLRGSEGTAFSWKWGSLLCRYIIQFLSFYDSTSTAFCAWSKHNIFDLTSRADHDVLRLLILVDLIIQLYLRTIPFCAVSFQLITYLGLDSSINVHALVVFVWFQTSIPVQPLSRIRSHISLNYAVSVWTIGKFGKQSFRGMLWWLRHIPRPPCSALTEDTYT